jgi:hypothetical protein
MKRLGMMMMKKWRVAKTESLGNTHLQQYDVLVGGLYCLYFTFYILHNIMNKSI